MALMVARRTVSLRADRRWWAAAGRSSGGCGPPRRAASRAWEPEAARRGRPRRAAWPGSRWAARRAWPEARGAGAARGGGGGGGGGAEPVVAAGGTGRPCLSYSVTGPDDGAGLDWLIWPWTSSSLVCAC